MDNTKTIYKIVVVEDEPSICQMYKFKLAKTGFNVRTAGDGEEGLKIIENFKPDLILLDLKMPKMTGDEMLEKLRSMKWGGSIRVIVLTNISKDEAPRSLRLLNVDRYVVKAHFTPSQVVEIVLEVLSGRVLNMQPEF